MSGATTRSKARLGVGEVPQWSPLAMSGATSWGSLRAPRMVAAAMEPARDERGDKVVQPADLLCVHVPQWSPLAMSGATRVPW